MEWLRKHSKEIFLGSLVLGLYFAIRLYNIMALPLFTDEAIYTRWTQIAKYDASWRFISLTDGKQPLFVWLNMIVLPFVSDPLLSGRLVSVLAGFGALTGLFFLGAIVFKNAKVGIFAVILYVFYPFALVYDRMALYDSLVACLAVWTLLFEILLVRYKRLDIALILGLILGGGLLTKSSSLFFIYLLPFSLLLFDYKSFGASGGSGALLKWIALAAAAVALGFGMSLILRLSPFFHIIGEKNTIFVYSFSEWRDHPFRFLVGNLKGMFNWLSIYMSKPVLFLTAASFFLGGLKFLREKLLLLIWFWAPFFALALFGKVLYPRFILFMTMPLLALSAYSLSVFFASRMFLLVKKFKFAVSLFLLAALLIFWLRSDYYILTDMARAPIPFADLEQYINGWPAGGGLREMVAFFEKKSQDQKIYVASEGTFGSLPTYAMEIYLDENRNIEKRGIWPIPEKIPEDLRERAKTMPVYFVFYRDLKPPKTWPASLIAKYQKGRGDSYLSIYEVVNTP